MKKEIKRAIRSYEQKLANDKKNPKRLFAYVNKKQSVRLSIHAIKDANNEIQTDRKRIANILNQQFASVFAKEDRIGDLPNLTPTRLDSDLTDIHVNSRMVIEKLEKLDGFKSMGFDKVSPYVLKKCSTSVAIPLMLVFRKSLAEGCVPNVWKLANVTPLHKKGSKLDKENYRPVSLTSVPCKILESIIRDKIMDHLKRNNIINEHQHGFVPRKACVTNLLETTDFITRNISQKCPIDIVFLDFAKAFDKVPHRRLLLKLENLGIKGSVLNWLRSFLTGRKQRVVLGDDESEWSDVLSGVPQGSVLAPILFIIFINDLPRSLKNPCKLYADDCKILAKITSEDDIRKLQADIHAATEWCQTWLMQLNVNKCKVMHFGRRNPMRSYTMLNTTNSETLNLETTNRERDLGIIITSDLKWNCQVASAASKANSTLGVLRNTFVSRESLLWKKLYTTYVRPHLEFAVSVWNPYRKADISTLEKVQRRATKVISGIRGMSYVNRCKTLGLTSLETRRHRGDLIQMFKIARSFEQVNWYQQPLSIEALRGKRSQMRREIVKSCDKRHYFFTNRIAKSWNELPQDVVESETVNEFKNRLDNHLKTAAS